MIVNQCLVTGLLSSYFVLYTCLLSFQNDLSFVTLLFILLTVGRRVLIYSLQQSLVFLIIPIYLSIWQ